MTNPLAHGIPAPYPACIDRGKGRKYRVTAVSSLIFACLLASQSVWEWGRIGHRVAAQMAESRLTPQALAAVHDLLGPGVSLAEISTWADEHRSPNSRAWHYVDVPIAESRYDPKYCPPGGCVVSKIGDFRRILMDPRADKPEKQEVMK
jgi:nuclease S1